MEERGAVGITAAPRNGPLNGPLDGPLDGGRAGLFGAEPENGVVPVGRLW